MSLSSYCRSWIVPWGELVWIRERNERSGSQVQLVVVAFEWARLRGRPAAS
jgi:hypothetical protein